uniref:Uncharacterized protein n=1 Tax=Arundo donax TaxID=35708 RepID=A0A0A9FTE5_ARUDO
MVCPGNSGWASARCCTCQWIACSSAAIAGCRSWAGGCSARRRRAGCRTAKRSPTRRRLRRPTPRRRHGLPASRPPRRSR